MCTEKLTDKGFRFIDVDEQEKGVFFHFKELIDVKFEDLKQGYEVNFEIVESPNGLNTTGVLLA